MVEDSAPSRARVERGGRSRVQGPRAPTPAHPTGRTRPPTSSRSTFAMSSSPL
ncbi:hypothetical protein T492DRAFT_960612 [Pavlovales sp. CCMP2436]|nr:hypothetical protein T492DRAFT_960612 [Pavlovales sp. CCMP2436]